ncbi:hypothetical protein IM876_23460 [Serratia plymuthica]|uniref:hypothetical protein n=1 Tax=Serratia plymuthica TaxID=82996 RepID=UPI001928F0A4|nr:hypothetical protein [Serratia plymuthica]MBL3525626.1 hypothetical protein [Serratia plymuthica]
MKRIFLACVAQCCSFSSQALVDLQYHAAQPLDNKISEDYRQKRSGLQHKIWSAEGVALANEKVLERERQRGSTEEANRRRNSTMFGERRCGNKSQQDGTCRLPGRDRAFPNLKRRH